jgi:hypothetical protein
MNEFVLRSGGRAQGFLARNFKIFPSRWEIHKKARVIPRERRLSTALSTVWSTAGSVGRDRECLRRARTPGPLTWVIRRTGPGQTNAGDERERRIYKRGPSMYEMEGPRRGHLAGPPITRLPGCHRVAPPGRENQPGRPVSRLSMRPPSRSGFPVRWSAGALLISILGGAEFLPLTPGWRKGFLP